MSEYPSFSERLKREDERIPIAISAFAARSGAKVIRFATSCNDRGIDAILEIGVFRLFVDFKLLGNGRWGDIPLEYEAHGKSGWAVDPDKATDLFVFYWERTGQMRIYQANALRLAAIDNRAAWLRDYGNQKVMERHGSIVAYVPPTVLEAAMTPDALVYGIGG